MSSNKKFLLDTDIVIDLIKNRFKLWDKVKNVGILNCYVSEITIAELHFGVHYSSRTEKHKNEPFEIAESFNVLPISDILEIFGKEKARLTQSGNRIPDFDLVIAVTAVKNDLIMVTGNIKHFNRVNKLVLENWRKPDFNEFL
ncbi:MAG: PIN domain-containing protein [Bacteroidota bacterium]